MDLNEVISEVIALTLDQMRSNDISFNTELAADLKPVLGDKVQLQQVMLNLIVNAIDAVSTIHDRRRRLAIVSMNEDGNGVRVELRDWGPGVEPQRVEQLFEPFYTTKPQGIGMGLWISRSIIEAHHGSLCATANAPHGAVFQFSLPTEESAPRTGTGGANGTRVNQALSDVRR